MCMWHRKKLWIAWNQDNGKIMFVCNRIIVYMANGIKMGRDYKTSRFGMLSNTVCEIISFYSYGVLKNFDICTL